MFNEELERLGQQKYNEWATLIDERYEIMRDADKGDPDALYKCSEISVILDKGQIYCGKDSYIYLEKAAQCGHTQAVKLFAILYLTGEIPDIGKGNVMPSPKKALEICDYFTEEALEQEDIKKLTQIIKEEVKKAK